MRDMDMEIAPRVDLIFGGRQLPDGMREREGGCRRLTFDQFCAQCVVLNRQMEARRLADMERTRRIRTQQERAEMGFVEMPETEGEDRYAVLENPVLAVMFGGLFTLAAGLVIWYAPRLVTRIGLWLSAGQ